LFTGLKMYKIDMEDMEKQKGVDRFAHRDLEGNV